MTKFDSRDEARYRRLNRDSNQLVLALCRMVARLRHLPITSAFNIWSDLQFLNGLLDFLDFDFAEAFDLE